MKVLILLITFVTLAACSVSPSADAGIPAYPDLLISLERGPCFGTCPIYTLTIHADGTVDYQGTGFVKVEGNRSIKISSEQIQELVTAIDNANFFSLKDQYMAPATDLPSITLSITLDGHSKSIWHYGMLDCSGELDDAPRELCELEDKIGEVVNSDQWVKRK